MVVADWLDMHASLDHVRLSAATEVSLTSTRGRYEEQSFEEEAEEEENSEEEPSGMEEEDVVLRESSNASPPKNFSATPTSVSLKDSGVLGRENWPPGDFPRRSESRLAVTRPPTQQERHTGELCSGGQQDAPASAPMLSLAALQPSSPKPIATAVPQGVQQRQELAGTASAHCGYPSLAGGTSAANQEREGARPPAEPSASRSALCRPRPAGTLRPAQSGAVKMTRGEAWTMFASYEACLQVCHEALLLDGGGEGGAAEARPFLLDGCALLRTAFRLEGLLLPSGRRPGGGGGAPAAICWEEAGDAGR
eukprot:CAMPEP_0177617612 /NCGR_PEP_ID=MMETSP0419_2-20121207/25015_1 /TAXON_ID=582737 /ORGANISM="Tetraselmis sp., Strain GSL018" /LENGTH=308 /DNA_ID=CAMNT_0019116215 /DNA_START=612 /DNA_END=1535 /DNA_ORIENTATION=+